MDSIFVKVGFFNDLTAASTASQIINNPVSFVFGFGPGYLKSSSFIFYKFYLLICFALQFGYQKKIHREICHSNSLQEHILFLFL